MRDAAYVQTLRRAIDMPKRPSIPDEVTSGEDNEHTNRMPQEYVHVCGEKNTS